MTTLWQDVRYGFRMLARKPGFAVIAILILGLGVGATTTLFSIVHGVLLRPLPYRDPERMVMLFTDKPGIIKRGTVSGLDFQDWKKQSLSFEDMAVFRGLDTTYQHEQGTDSVRGLCVSTNLFALLGLQARVGRTFLPEETWPNDHFIILGHDFWQRRFGGDESAPGRAVTLGASKEPYTVVGVMPPGVRFFNARSDAVVDFWVPADRDFPEMASGGRGCLRWNVLARLKPGVTTRAAQAEMDVIARQLWPDPKMSLGVEVLPLHTFVVGETRPLILLAGGAAVFVLLVACANVANLLLAQGLARRRELAVRASLGAGRSRLVREMLTESILLAALGTLAGLALTVCGLSLFRAMVPSSIPRLEQVGLDAATLLFALGAVLLTGLAVGLVPALRASRLDLHSVLKDETRGTTMETGRRRLTSLLVAAEVSLSLILLMGAGLLINSLSRLLLLDPGYRTDGILTVRMSHLSVGDCQEVQRRVQSLPGVEGAALACGVPLCENAGSSPVVPEGRPEFGMFQEIVEGKRKPDMSQLGPDSFVMTQPGTRACIVTPGYFGLMGIALLAGRDFAEHDDRTTPAVAIVNENLARLYWPEEDPVGKHIVFPAIGKVLEIVGVVRSTKNSGLDAESGLEAFIPLSQRPSDHLRLVVATRSHPERLADAVRREIWSVQRNAVIPEIRSMTEIVGQTLSVRRFLVVALSVFSLAAVILTTIGIYGVVAHSVRQRTHEIGIRMALGATSTDALTRAVGQGLRLTCVGLAFGLAGALVLTRVISSFLYDISPTDPVTFVIVSLVLMGAALLASYLPARRAARIDPMVALRYE